MKANFLDWDSTFFNLRIGKVLCTLPVSIDVADIEDFDLLYCYADPQDKALNNLLVQQGGVLVDEKVMFVKKAMPAPVNNEITIHQKGDKDNDEKVVSVGIQSGEFSRFNVDQNFGNAQFFRLYREWIEKSISREIADEVFVYKETSSIRGVITFKVKSGRGDIGILAVDKDSRGKQIGKKLVQMCENYCVHMKVDELQVVTQLANKHACTFYKKYGFNIESITNVYHLWTAKAK